MREIKFRGRRIDNGEWVAGHYLTRRTKDQGLQHMVSVQDMWGFHEVDPETVGQYVGLKDKNGKEVYEGDIMFWEHDSIKTYTVVEFYDGMFLIDSAPLADHLDEIVIGNIYENPNLLKE